VTAGFGTRDGENEAFIVDRYLDSLLAREPLDVTDVPPELRATAALLLTGLPRHHPSFRFEEALAARLGAPPARGAAGEVLAFPRVAVVTDVPVTPDGRPAAFRPAVIGGVLTSAAISLAGAAFVAWRRSRPAADPWAQAIRAAARRRTA
jgi:hypothetical protein